MLLLQFRMMPVSTQRIALFARTLGAVGLDPSWIFGVCLPCIRVIMAAAGVVSDDQGRIVVRHEVHLLLPRSSWRISVHDTGLRRWFLFPAARTGAFAFPTLCSRFVG